MMRSYYDPNLTFPFGETMYPPTAVSGEYDPNLAYPFDERVAPFAEAAYDESYGYPVVISGPAPSPGGIVHDAWYGLQNLGQSLSHGFEQLPTLGHSLATAVDQPAQLAQSARKAGQAAEELQKQASLVGDDASRALAATEDAAKAVKYVAYGLGGLAAVVLVVSLIKSTID